jgi:glyoxylase-like metal-dependent hydrolase (beta-lactamase superfamily II)
MEIRTLGTGSGKPSPQLNTSCVLVKTAGATFLLDAGEGCSRLLLKAGIGAQELDAVLITHLHPDHVSGVFMLIQMLYLAGRTKALNLYLPEREDEFLALLQMFYTFPVRFDFELKILPISEISSDFPGLSCYKNDHLIGYRDLVQHRHLPNQLCSYSLKVSSAAGNFVYSSDLSSIDSIADFIKGAHTLLVDAGHPATEQIQKLQDYGISRILLTHEPRFETKQWLAQNPDPRYREAADGEIYHI